MTEDSLKELQSFTVMLSGSEGSYKRFFTSFRMTYIHHFCALSMAKGMYVNMAVFDKEIDITRNIKLIEWLKKRAAYGRCQSFQGLLPTGCVKKSMDAVADIISNLILISYLLGKRLGISYNAIEMKVHNKIRLRSWWKITR